MCRVQCQVRAEVHHRDTNSRGSGLWARPEETYWVRGVRAGSEEGYKDS